jgi:hypothetical protein
MTASISNGESRSERDSVCVVCGGLLASQRPDARHCSPAARHCSPACRVEASRIRAILSGSYSGPYRSVRERLQAAQKGVQNALAANDEGSLTGSSRSAGTTAIGKTVPRS